MSKYQLKSEPSVIVEAVQFNPHQHPWPKGVISWDGKPRPRDMSWGYIDTPSKREHVWVGDYIVLDRQGKPYPVRSQLFEEAYRPIVVIGIPLQESAVVSKQECLKRPIILKWTTLDGTESTEGGLDEDELALRTMRLLTRYIDGDVLNIKIER
jgi:hypothetical protein